MNTISRSLTAWLARSGAPTCALAVAAFGLLPAAGCGRYGGLAYFLGVGRGTKIEPQYVLPEGTLLILVDDPDEHVTWPRTRDLLQQFLGEELLAHKAVTAVISPDSVARFRQADERFERYAAVQIGRKLSADTVMWIEVRDFFAPEEIEDTSTAAKITVSVKILTTHEEERADRVRLWPTDEGGYIHQTQLSAVQVHRLKGDNAVERELARRAAIQLGRLFYQHTVGEVDDSGV